jgi:16S rRNA (guanine966-N2)-methyltransferase
MRVIAGIHKGRRLKSPPSMQVRPTSDRLRETLFNVIAPRVQEARFLDLCAGSGAVGIEALSRGASHVTFVDRSRKMCGLIESNLDLCRIPEEDTEIVNATAEDFLKQGKNRQVGPWDIIFFDPPYKNDYLEVLRLLRTQARAPLDKDGVLIIEHHHKTELPQKVDDLMRVRILQQGDSALSFYELLK